jgi:hypothetical protein
MAIDVRPATATIGFGTPGGSAAFMVPSTCQAGDIILAALHAEDNGTTNPTLTPPAGEGYTAYTDVEHTTSTPDFHDAVYWKRADAGDASQSHTWSVANCSWLGGIMILIPGALASGDPNNVTPTTATGGPNLSVVAPTITPASAPWLEVVFADGFFSSAATPPAGMTEAVDISGCTFAYLRQTTTSSPGTRTVVQTGTAGSNYWIGGHYAFTEDTGAVAKAPPPLPMRRLLPLVVR